MGPAAKFGQEVRRRRDARRWARDTLAARSGASVPMIQRLEMDEAPPKPRRNSVVDLCLALAMDVDQWLGVFGYTPLTAEELAHLPATPAESPRGLLERVWGELSPAQQDALARLAVTMAWPDVASSAQDDPSAVWTIRIAKDHPVDGDREPHNDTNGAGS